jgi:hypothetical protein
MSLDHGHASRAPTRVIEESAAMSRYFSAGRECPLNVRHWGESGRAAGLPLTHNCSHKKPNDGAVTDVVLPSDDAMPTQIRPIWEQV